MAEYKWKHHELGTDGIPHVKKAPVTLERAGDKKKFRTQEEVDAAWAAGWHDTGRPETADVPYETKGENLHTMKKTALVELAAGEGLEIDMSMDHKDMIHTIKTYRKDKE